MYVLINACSIIYKNVLLVDMPNTNQKSHVMYSLPSPLFPTPTPTHLPPPYQCAIVSRNWSSLSHNISFHSDRTLSEQRCCVFVSTRSGPLPTASCLIACIMYAEPTITWRPWWRTKSGAVFPGPQIKFQNLQPVGVGVEKREMSMYASLYRHQIWQSKLVVVLLKPGPYVNRGFVVVFYSWYA